MSADRAVRPEERERLDDVTEGLIANIVWGDRGSVPLLRERIRTLNPESPRPLQSEPTAPTSDSRFTGGSGYYASCDVTPEDSASRPQLADFERLLREHAQIAYRNGAAAMNSSKSITDITPVESALRDYVEQLSQDVLTPEEARTILALPTAFMGPKVPEALIAKLTRISSAANKKEDAK